MSRFGDYIITIIGGGCAQALKALKDNTSELANNIARGILGVCGVLAFWGALSGGPTKKPELPPPADTPAQHAPAPASSQDPKKGKKGIEQPPNKPVKPARRGQEGFIVLSNGTILYFERKQKQTKILERKKIQKPQSDILDAEYEEYCQNFNLIDE